MNNQFQQQKQYLLIQVKADPYQFLNHPEKQTQGNIQYDQINRQGAINMQTQNTNQMVTNQAFNYTRYEPSSLQKQFKLSNKEYQIIIDKLLNNHYLDEIMIFKQALSNHSYDQFIFKEQFKILKHLANGSFSQVYLAKEIQSSMLIAVKLIKKDTISKFNICDAIVREIKIQQSLSHINLIPLFGYFQDELNVYLVSQYCEQGELLTFLKKTKDDKRIYVKELVTSVAYMHSKGIMHRDLKPENILISANSLKIGDFGCAARFPTPECRRTSFCGTIDYLSPEMITGGGKIPDPDNLGLEIYRGYDEKCDIWAIGVVIYEIYVGHTPFASKSEKDIQLIMNLICEGYFSMPSNVPLLLQDLIYQCINKDPNKRPSSSQLLLHDWFII